MKILAVVISIVIVLFSWALIKMGERADFRD